MTTICAVVGTDGSSALVADGLLTARDLAVSNTECKIDLISSDWAIALAGSLRSSFIARQISDPTGAQDIANRIKDGMKTDNWKFDDERGSPPSVRDHGFIVHRDGRIWEMFSDFAISLVELGSVRACGTGCEIAIGSAATLNGLSEYDPLGVAKSAVRVAMGIDIYSGGMLHWLKCGEQEMVVEREDGKVIRFDQQLKIAEVV